MTSLYPDESYCTSPLGHLLFQPKADFVATGCVVSCTDEKNITGTYTVYNIEIKVINDHHERTFSLCTRFKELQKLHGGLSKLHKQLFLRGIFPGFPSPRIFGSNEPAVIDERRQGTDQFISFVLDSEVLRKARILHEFLEKSRESAQTARAATPDAFLYDNTSSILDAPLPNANRNSLPAPISPTAEVTQQERFDWDDDGRRSAQRDGEPTSVGDFQFPELNIENTPPPTKESRKTATMKKLFPRLNAPTNALPNQATAAAAGDYLVRAGHLVATAQRAEQEHAYELAFQCYKSAASSLIQGVQLESDMGRRNAVRRKTAKYLVKAERLYRTYLSYDGSVFNADALLTASMQDPNIIAFQCSNKSLRNYRFISRLPHLNAPSRNLLVEERTGHKTYVMKLMEKGLHGEGKIFLPTNIPHMVHLVQFFETDDQIILTLEYVEHGCLWDFLQRYFLEAESRYLLSLVDTNVEVRDGSSVSVVSLPSDAEGSSKNNRTYRGRRLLFTVGVDFERVAEMRDEAQSTEDPSTSSLGVVCTMGVDVTGRDSAPSGDFYIIGETSEAVQGISLNVSEESPAAVRLDFDGTAAAAEIPESSMMTSTDRQSLFKTRGTDAMQLASALREVRHQLSLRRRAWPANVELPEALLVHWFSQLVSFMFILHTEHSEYIGDFQPNNLLLDVKGNLIMTYHGHWFNNNRRHNFVDGYSAPECFVYGWKPNAQSDIWTLGAIMFELVSGRSLANAAPHGVQRSGELPFPDDARVSFVAKDIISLILTPVAALRPTLDEIRSHPFFRAVDWSLYDNPSLLVATLSSSTSSLDQEKATFEPAPLAPELLLNQDQTI